MRHKYLTKFKPGDKVQHKQCPSMKGTFDRYSKPYNVSGRHPFPAIRYARRCFWVGWDPFCPEREEWTWEWAMEFQPAGPTGNNMPHHTNTVKTVKR